MRSKPAVILTDYRTGGSFLSLALDSHSLIYCARAEPLSKTGEWWEQLGAPLPILKVIFAQEMCKVAMLKVIYRQAGDGVWSHLREVGAKVVHLVRENELRASASFLFHKRLSRGEVKRKGARRKLHLYTPVSRRKLVPKPIELPPDDLLRLMLSRRRVRKANAEKLERYEFSHLTVTYRDMVGGERAEVGVVRSAMGHDLCKFLGVPYESLRGSTRKVNAYPLRLLVGNWVQVKKVISESEFASYLELEEKWEKDGRGNWVV